LFLHGFRRDLLKPIERDGREHVEYVPTQVVTEYLRLAYRLPEEGEPRLDGLMFTSTRDGGTNVVLFVGPDACGSTDTLDRDKHEMLRLRLEDAEIYDLRWSVSARPRPRVNAIVGRARA